MHFKKQPNTLLDKLAAGKVFRSFKEWDPGLQYLISWLKWNQIMRSWISSVGDVLDFVNKRGAASGKTTKEDLHQFYDLSDEENDENSTLEQKGKDIIK